MKTIRSIYSILALVFCSFPFDSGLTAQSQHPEPCAFDHFRNHYDLPSLEQQIQTGIQKVLLNQSLKHHDFAYTIPVVVHIIHQGGSENISDAQIHSGIEVMNEDYSKLVGTPGDGSGVDTEVRFKLANIDPNGHCTNGIIRAYTTLTNHQPSERLKLKELSSWDNMRYLNVYIVASISGGTAGYSSFPGGPADEDGFVLEHIYFGRIGTAASSMGRTATHEAGHWLGLFHTFHDGCGADTCAGGDMVCDTPPAAAPNYGCPTVNSCNLDVPDVNDQIENYMDYSDDNCQNMFSAGQRDRIHGSLNSIRTVIWTDSNLVNTGTDSNYSAPFVCPIVANLVSLTQNICVGNSVDFVDISLNNPSSWEWTFEGGSIHSSTDQNPTVTYDSVGTYDVTLKVSDGIVVDSIVLSNYIVVSEPGIGDNLPLREDFESGNYPPDQLSIVNYDAGITWQLDSNAAAQGNYSISINNLDNTNYGTLDELQLPYIDFTSIDTNFYFKFKYAYARSVSAYSDLLTVEISTDCGASFENLISKEGNSLATAPTQTTPFIPDSSQWREVALDLSQYKDDTYVKIKFVNTTDGGNYLYLDDIQVGNVFTSADLDQFQNVDIHVYPNPSNDLFFIDIPSNQKHQIGEVVLYNTEGRRILTQPNTNPLNVSGLASGMYWLSVNNRNMQRIYSTLLMVR